MTDHYLEFAQHPLGNRLLRALRLPLPIPPRLERSAESWVEQPLAGDAVVFGTTARSPLGPPVVSILLAAGARVHVPAGVEPAFELPPDCEHAEAQAPHALVFDAAGLIQPSELRTLYDFFQPRLRRLRACGRVIVLGRPPAIAPDPVAAATAEALEGFCRSLAKETGHRGTTVQLLAVEPGAEARIEGPLRFLLSRHSAYVDGEVWTVTRQVISHAATPWTRPLAGKTALVTGAARGIGAAIAQVLAREGARVVLVDRPEAEPDLGALADRLGGIALAHDIVAAATPDRLAQALRQQGGVHIVVHNAGITRDRTLARMPADGWDAVLDINLAAVLRIDQALLQGVLREDGRIVCLSSISGIGGQRGQTHYAATKAGLIGYAGALSRRLAPRGITVNAVAPGFIETRMTAAIPFLGRQIGRRLNALSQGGLPVDVAEVVAFLASPGAVGLSGGVIRVCGQNLLGA